MDMRVRITKKLIREAFFSILKEKPVTRMTVTELCEKADINRTTFYKYYADPLDLMDKIENEVLDDLQKQIVDQGSEALDEVFTLILNDISKRRDLYLPLFNQSGGQVFRQRIFAQLYDYNRKVILEFFPDAPDNRRDWLYYFIANGCTSVLDQWIMGGMKQQPREVVLFLIGLIDTINHQAEIDFKMSEM